MITQKDDFKQGVINIFLFSSMLNPAEMYLSRETKKINRSNDLKGSITNIVTNTLSLFRKKTIGRSLDNEIEAAIEDTKNPRLGNNLLAKDENTDFLSNIMKYDSKEPVDEIKTALKNLYSTFVSYAKSAYSAAASYTQKVVTGPVKITMLKLIRVFEYILTALNPQWNKVPGSPQDLDTLAPAITNHISTGKDSLKYNSGYGALRYWHK